MAKTQRSLSFPRPFPPGALALSPSLLTLSLLGSQPSHILMAQRWPWSPPALRGVIWTKSSTLVSPSHTLILEKPSKKWRGSAGEETANLVTKL